MNKVYLRSKTPQANLIDKKTFSGFYQPKTLNKLPSSSKQKEVKSSSTNKLNQSLFLEKANRTIQSRNSNKLEQKNDTSIANKILVKKSLTLTDNLKTKTYSKSNISMLNGKKNNLVKNKLLI